MAKNRVRSEFIAKEGGGMEFGKLFIELFRLLEPCTYMELGIKAGYTFNQLSPLVKRAIAVDAAAHEDVIINKNVEYHIMTTDDFSEIWTDPIDFLFIDALHEKEQVLRDFNHFAPFVVENTGVIALHDTYPVQKSLLEEGRCWNAWEAAWELRTNPVYSDYEFFTIPGPYAGLTLMRRAKKQVGWM